MDIGAKLREARLKAGLTMVEVAEKVGMTSSHISQVERNIASPSIGALVRICDALDIRVASLFLSKDDAVLAPSEPFFGLVRGDRRKALILPGSSLRNEMLCPDLRHDMEACWSFLDAGADTGDVPFSHEGEEMAVVLKGTLQFTFGERTEVLEKGDSIYFDAKVPHSWKNIGDEEAELLWAATPPHF